MYTGLHLSVVPFILPSVLPLFRNTFSSKISPQLFKIETSYLVYRSTTTSCIVGLQMDILLFVLPFSFFPNFSSKISPQPLKIKTSYLVYRFTTTSGIVGLKMNLLLFVLSYICSFISCSPDFRQRYLHNCLR